MPEWPVLNVSIRHRIAALTLHVEFQLSKPWTVLFAPSGAGKTTILRVIAGLSRADHEHIAWKSEPVSVRNHLRHRVLSDTATKRFIPPHARCLPMTTQDAALFPHLSVADNVLYGSRMAKGTSRPSAAEQRDLKARLELCRIDHLIDKFPSQLSGGERQKVALARTLGANASAILLDEPFAALDGAVKDALMQDVKAWLGRRSVPVLHVTHDVGEVYAIADEVIRLGDGMVVSRGQPNTVLQGEKTRLSGWLNL